MRDYNQKTVIITGAGGGLGAALAARFAQAGARVGGIDVNEAGLQATQQQIEVAGGTFVWKTCDITDAPATHTALQVLESELGPTYCLINNAGITHLKNFKLGESEPIKRVMNVNLFGTVHCTEAVFENVVKNDGQIIGISSVAGYAPLVGRTSYCASKHALEGFLNTLRTELHETNVNVLVVCPSFIATGIRQKYEMDAADAKGQKVGNEDTPEEVAEQIFQAARRNKRRITTGFVGAVSSLLWKFMPRFYERLMLKKVQAEH